MLCYRDRTFCQFWRNCDNQFTCSQVLTDDVKLKAGQMGLPICLFSEVPDCHSSKGQTKGNVINQDPFGDKDD